MRTFTQKPKVIQQTKTAKSTKPSRPLSGQSRDAHSILQLQRTIGNQAVQRLQQSRAEELQAGSATTASTRFGHDFSRIPIFSPSPVQVQPRLMVSAPVDMYEQEAGCVGDAVMRIPETQTEQMIQRQPACPCDGGCPRCQGSKLKLGETKDSVPRVPWDGAPGVPLGSLLKLKLDDQPLPAKGTVDRDGSSALRASTSGSRMPKAVRNKMETAFGTDFSDVRISQGIEASSIGALAFTQGDDIHFAPGQYDPSSQSGQKLLGHELTHVVQQREGRVRPTAQTKGFAINDDPALEAEADRAGGQAVSGERVDYRREPSALRDVSVAVAQAKVSRTSVMNPDDSSWTFLAANRTVISKRVASAIRVGTKHSHYDGWTDTRQLFKFGVAGVDLVLHVYAQKNGVLRSTKEGWYVRNVEVFFGKVPKGSKRVDAAVGWWKPVRFARARWNWKEGCASVELPIEIRVSGGTVELLTITVFGKKDLKSLITFKP